MKKIISTLLAFVMLVGCVLTFVSCARPELDLSNAKANLEKAGYDVDYSNDKEELKAEGFIGAIEALEADKDEEDILIVTFDKVKTAKLYLKEYELQRDRQIEYTEWELKNAKHMVKAYEDQLDADEIADYNEEIEELEEELEELKESLVLGRSGKTIWIGTKAAIDASKGK